MNIVYSFFSTNFELFLFFLFSMKSKLILYYKAATPSIEEECGQTQHDRESEPQCA